MSKQWVISILRIERKLRFRLSCVTVQLFAYCMFFLTWFSLFVLFFPGALTACISSLAWSFLSVWFLVQLHSVAWKRLGSKSDLFAWWALLQLVQIWAICLTLLSWRARNWGLLLTLTVSLRALPAGCDSFVAACMSSSYRSSRFGLSHWDPYTMHRGGFLELYYCNMVEWCWSYSSLIYKTN